MLVKTTYGQGKNTALLHINNLGLTALFFLNIRDGKVGTDQLIFFPWFTFSSTQQYDFPDFTNCFT